MRTGIMAASPWQASKAMLKLALWRTVSLYREPAVWRGLQKTGMGSDSSWRDSAQKYAAIYRELVESRA
jgi:starch synthase